MSFIINNKRNYSQSKLYTSNLTEPFLHDVEERSYISRKMSKIRWKPEGMDEYSPYFLTGTYDNPQKNSVDLWRYSLSQDPEEPATSDFVPTLMSGMTVNSNVTGINFVDQRNLFAYSTYNGTVGLVKISNDEDPQIKQVYLWDSEEWFGSRSVSCTSLDCYDSQLAAGALDGSICLISPESPKNVGTLCDSKVPVHSLCFIGKDELIAASMLGTITLWDLRSQNVSPVNSIPFSRSERVGVTALTNFHTEKHMLVCGGRNGMISVIDLRNLPIPVRVFKTCNSPVAELRFHPSRYSILYSCSSDGEIWQWTNFFQLFDPIRNQDFEMLTNRTLGLETNIDKSALIDYKNVKPQVKSLLKNNKFFTNSLDLNKDRLICGTDNECVIAIKSLQLY